MPTLDWMGKSKVVNHHRDVPYRVLVRDAEKSMLDSNGSDCGNMIIHGDNLEALKALLPEYEGKVDCIYIDPPYNTGNEGWVYNDNVKDPRIQKWLGQVVGKEGEDFSRHDKWLCMMYPRLQLLRKMLAPTGVIFISIDDNECAALKYACDEIFGVGCFQGDISWQRAYSPRNDKHGMPNEVEHLLVYSISADWMPGRLERTEEMDSSYSNPDNDSAPWTSSDGFAPNAVTHQGMVYAIQHPFKDELIYPYNSACWRYDQQTMLDIFNGWCEYELRDIADAEKRAEICGISPNEVRDGVKAIMIKGDVAAAREHAKHVLENGPWPRYYFTRNGLGGVRRKTYLTAVEGKLPTNLWLYSEVGHTDEGAKELKAIFEGKAVFQNPKPSRLIRRVLEVGCPKDGLVLDAFGGSGTTAQAVLQENEINNASRRFILVEMGDYADTITAERARRTITGYAVDKANKTRLYEKKLTASNLAKCGNFYAEALSVKEAAANAGDYNKVEGPKMDGNALIVEGVTNKGEDVPGVDSGFSFYELGPVLFDSDGALNPEVSRENLKRYVWYTVAHCEYVSHENEHPYLLGEFSGSVYYLAYEPNEETTLTFDLLKTFTRRGAQTVVYADRCAIAQERLDEMNVVFKQVPREIVRV